MGLIIRQGLKASSINFLGVLIGMVSTLYIYPLNLEAYGFASNLYVTATFFAALFTLGFGSALVKFFPKFKLEAETYPSGLLMTMYLGLGVGLVAFVGVSLIGKLQLYALLAKLDFDVSIFKTNELLIGAMVIFISSATLFSAYSSNFGRIAFPSAINNFGYKLWLPITILLLTWQFIPFCIFRLLIPSYYLIAAVIIMVYLKYNNFFDFKIDIARYKPKWKEVAKFTAISNFTSLGSMIAFRVDTIMISGYLGFVSTGVYGLAMTIPAVLDVPMQAISGLTSPIISKHWATHDIDAIGVIYKKSSTNLLIIGILILLGGYFCYDDLAALSSNTAAFQKGKIAFIFLAIAKLIDMVTSVNGGIIGYSDKYHVNSIFIFILAVLNIALNYLLIPTYGIEGAAFATFISLAIFNALKSFYIFFRYKLNPFSLKSLYCLLIGIITFGMAYMIPDTNHPLLNIAIKSLLITLVFCTLVYKLNISDEVKKICDDALSKVKSYFKK